MIGDRLFTSARERRLWLWIAAMVLAIFSTLGLARTLAVRLGGGPLGAALFIAGCCLVLAAIVTQGLSRRPGRIEVGLGIGTLATYLLVFVRMVVPTERSHLIEYAVVAVFIHEALRERARGGRRVPWPAALAWIATAGIGALDESVQCFWPGRFFDPVDMLFNALAAGMAVGTGLILRWVRRRLG